MNSPVISAFSQVIVCNYRILQKARFFARRARPLFRDVLFENSRLHGTSHGAARPVLGHASTIFTLAQRRSVFALYRRVYPGSL